MAESITITDNRNGESIEIPIVDGGVAAEEWAKLLPGTWFYDPGFMSTAACESAITYLDGDAGILRYRGYPIEQLAESSTYLEVAYLLLNGELPTGDPVRDLAPRRHVPHVHPRERPQAVPQGVPLRRPPDGDAGFRRGRPLDLLPQRQGHLRPELAQQADHPADRQDADPGRRRPPLQRGHALRVPGQHAQVRPELPLHALEGGGTPLRGRPRALPRATTSSSFCTPTTSRTAPPPPCGWWAPRTPIPTRPPPLPLPRCTDRATAGRTRPSSGC